LGQKEIEELKKAISRFHSLRNKTNEFLLLGTKNLTPVQVAEKVRALRDPETELQAVEDLRTILALIHSQEPEDVEPKKALASLGSLGVIPFVIYPIVAGGAISLTSLFNYLAKREERIMGELQGGSFMTNPITLLAVGAGSLMGGVYLWKKYKKGTKNENKEEIKKESTKKEEKSKE
jgi:hypothetical protein